MTIQIFEETLRDGLQSCNFSNLSIEDKKNIIILFDRLGIEACNLGFINSSVRENDEIIELISFIKSKQLRIEPYVICRMKTSDLEEVNCISKKLEIKISSLLYIGVSRKRMYIEGWDEIYIYDAIFKVLNFAKDHEMQVSIALEDSTRMDEKFLKKIISLINDFPVYSIALADTLGISDYEQTLKLVSFVKKRLRGNIIIEWHGHNDLGLAVSNSLAAIKGGAKRIHTCMLGIGERCGNTSTEQLLINLYMKNELSSNIHMKELRKIVKLLQNKLKIDIPKNYPCFGEYSFFTCAGTHGAAIYKENILDDNRISVFTPYIPQVLGRTMEVGVNRTSGEGNIKYLNSKYSLGLDEKKIKNILEYVKCNNLFFNEKEFVHFVKS
ncbi:hypothetical protein RsY01_461 [Lactococcus reticulitermitis]|uniref:Pyruvate carboxyltransferase domain-containing protein n=2 Tax=Pseudolactococcus reticulitermitis TaxID=2025039 RepID=A0A224XB56_9LACT|nr:hypothetical protein RsY01_461 [Lactococcus reticulitermitis]